MKKLAWPLFLAALVLLGCHKEEASLEKAGVREFALGDFAKSRIGVLTGSSQEAGIAKKYPEAVRVPLRSSSDLVMALEKNKIDCFCLERKIVQKAISERPGLAAVKEGVLVSDTAFAFRKTPQGEALRDEFNAFLARARADGRFVAISNSFNGQMPLPWTIDTASLNADKGLLKCCTSADLPGYSFFEKSGLTGLDIELAKLFCKEAGYGLEFQIMDFGSLISSLSSGNSDFVASGLVITDERSQKVAFSDPVSSDDSVLCYSAAFKGGKKERKRQLADFAKERIGTAKGTLSDVYFSKYMPQAVNVRFPNTTNLLMAVQSGQLKAAMADLDTIRCMLREDSGLAYVEEAVFTNSIALAFAKTPKGETIFKEFNEFLAWAEKDGILSVLVSDFGNCRSHDLGIRPESLKCPRGILNFVTAADYPGASQFENGRLTGRDVELALLFCQRYGYGFRPVIVDFDAVFPILAKGEADFGGGGLTITEERAKDVNFSTPVISDSTVILYKKNGEEEKNPESKQGECRLADFAKAKVGTVAGTLHDIYLDKYMPKATSVPYRGSCDLLIAVQSGAMKVGLADLSSIVGILKSNPDLDYVKEPVFTNVIALAFAKNPKGEVLLKEFNEFLDWAANDGILTAITNDFACGRSHDLGIRPENLKATRGVLNFVTAGDYPGASQIENGRLTGRDVELALLFCQKYDYGLKPLIVDFDAMIPALTSGKADFCGSALTITEERAGAVNFSQPVFYDPAVLFYFKGQGEEPVKGRKMASFKLSDFANDKIGTEAGTQQEALFKKHFPKAVNVSYRSAAEILVGVQSGYLDAGLTDLGAVSIVLKSRHELDYVKEAVFVSDIALAFPKTPKGETILKEFNEFLAWAVRDGIFAAITNDFACGRSHDLGIRIEDLKAPRGVLNFATSGRILESSYFENGRLTGRDAELALLFCQKYGYGLKLVIADFPDLIPALVSGKADFCGNNMTVTEERAKLVNFSNLVFRDAAVLFYSTAHRLQNQEDKGPKPQDFFKSRIGVLAGSVEENYLGKLHHKTRLVSCRTVPDLVMALERGMVDCFCVGESTVMETVKERSDIKFTKDYAYVSHMAFAFSKNPRGEGLLKEFNAFFDVAKKDGSYAAITNAFNNGLPYEGGITPQNLKATKGIVKFATTGDFAGQSYIKDGRLTGADVELALLFCQRAGYGIEYQIMDLSSILTSLAVGKSDFCGNSLTITEERKENMNFSQTLSVVGSPFFYSQSRWQIKQEPDQKGTGLDENGRKPAGESWAKRFMKGLLASVQKTFIEENRYRLLLKGFGVTCLISVAGLLFGTIFGFFICFFRMESSPIVRLLAICYVKFFQGTPIVVVLMIFYYVIFGRTGLSALTVAVLTFGLNFAAFFSEILRAGIETVDKGQWEAALALGYSQSGAFLRFVLPQAMTSFLPVYRGEAIALMKSTSVAGYVAVQDLTKMVDIIRSRTYEAFFPLLVAAIAYFILAYCIFLVVERLIKAVTPDKGKRNIKEVRLP